MRYGFFLIGGLAVFLVAGCASRPINQPLHSIDQSNGYRGNVIIPQRPDNDHSALFVLSFSGGGTRAAALSYGVLEESGTLSCWWSTPTLHMKRTGNKESRHRVPSSN